MYSVDEFGCDYDCRTVGEGIIKYDIPDDWHAEFDVYDGSYPFIGFAVGEIRRIPAMMDLKLRIVENEEDELAGCMVLTEKKIIGFKIDYLDDLIKAIKAE